MNTLADALFDGWEDSPRVFLHFPDGGSVTRGEFTAMSSHFAVQLQQQGVSSGARVAAQVEKSPEVLALYAACIRIGAVFLPLNTAYTASEIAYFLDDAAPALFVHDAALDETSGKEARQANVAASVLNADGSGDFSFAGDAPTVQNAACAADAPASILYTSGTTGKPKGAVLSHLNLLSNARVLAKFWEFSERDILLHILPIFHVHGLFTATNTVLAAGASMLFMPSFDPAKACALMPRASVMMGVPTHYTRLLACPDLSRECTSGMRLFVSGSAPLLAETHVEFEQRTGQKILERYGMSETGMNASNPYHGERRPGAVGFPLPGTGIRIADEQTGKDLPPGEIGSIELKGDNVFSGYWNKPQQTAESFRADGYFITGDMGKFDEDGYLHIIGRAKDLIISGGLNVYPKEVEAAINELPGVLESAVIGAPHADFGEGVIAVIVAQNGEEVVPEKITAALSDKLAKFKLPKQIYIEPELPRNAMGKVQKNLLRDKYQDTFA